MNAAVLSLIVCSTLLATAGTARSADAIASDAPVPGGLTALAAVAEVSPVPDRARFVSELARVVYSSPSTGPYSNEPIRRRIDAFFAEARQQPDAASGPDVVPVPFTPAFWSQTVFHRTVERRDLVGAILADRPAALLCYGFAGMDDETLEFLAAHAPLVSRLAERAPAMVAAFGESLHIHADRVVPPGGDAAAALWEAVVGERVDRPERFVQMLFENERGRTAYLWDVLSHVSAPALAFALDAQAGDAEERIGRFRRLAAVARRGFVEWDATLAPFVRPPNGFAAFFARVPLDADGRVTGLASPGFWQRAIEGSGPSVAPAVGTASAAWLAEFLLGHPPRERERRLDTFAFGQRVFSGDTAAADDAIPALRGFATYPVLMLTLERMGTRAPSVYAAASQLAERLTDLDQVRGTPALAQLQGAVALLARLVRVRTLDPGTAERLARELFACPLTDGRFNGTIAAWMNDRLRPALPPAAAPANGGPASIDDALLAAIAGPPPSGPPTFIEWEGQRYRIDVGGAELQRLQRVRDKQAGIRFELALGLASLARRLGEPPVSIDTVRAGAAALTAAAADLSDAASRSDADRERAAVIHDAAQTLEGIRRSGEVSAARRVAAPIAAVADVLLGQALLSLAYACDLGDPEGTILIAGDPSRHHDFGYAMPGREARVKAMWGVAITETRNSPSHLVGSALALDLALAPLALRRITTDRIPESPMLNLVQRDGFAATVAVMDPLALTDAARDEIADRIERGRRRLTALDPGAARALAAELHMDGWRRRALDWTVRQDPAGVAGLLTTTELIVLGGGAPSTFDAWGTYALRTRGCLCSELAGPSAFQLWWGLSQIGLPAALVSDLALDVAVVLHNLHVPAVMAKPVLAAAMQDFVDSVNPTDGNDWLTLSRAARVIGPERFEDYVAAATADGPLLPAGDR